MSEENAGMLGHDTALEPHVTDVSSERSSTAQRTRPTKKHLPSSAHALYSMGMSYYYRARVKDATQCFERCLQLDPGFSAAHYWLGLVSHHAGDLPGSTRHFEKLLEQSPWAVVADYHIGINLSAVGDHARAIAHLARVVESCPDHESARYHLGMAYYAAGRTMEALETFRGAVRLDPRDTRSSDMLELLSNVVAP